MNRPIPLPIGDRYQTKLYGIHAPMPPMPLLLSDQSVTRPLSRAETVLYGTQGGAFPRLKRGPRCI